MKFHLPAPTCATGALGLFHGRIVPRRHCPPAPELFPAPSVPAVSILHPLLNFVSPARGFSRSAVAKRECLLISRVYAGCSHSSGALFVSFGDRPRTDRCLNLPGQRNHRIATVKAWSLCRERAFFLDTLLSGLSCSVPLCDESAA